MPSDAIRVSDLLYRWKPGLAPCLDIPDFTVAHGERVFLHGPSGSGKSTLLGLLGGIAVPERGQVTLLGHELTCLGGRARDRLRADSMGFLFQQSNLLPWLSALDNVVLPCTFSSRRKARASNPQAEAERLLSHLDLGADLWHKPAAELSVGQQQRVAAARALIGQPEIVLADEPTSALDASRQMIFVDLLLVETRAAGAALLFVSHDARLAIHFDRTVDLADINRASLPAGAAA